MLGSLGVQFLVGRSRCIVSWCSELCEGPATILSGFSMEYTCYVGRGHVSWACQRISRHSLSIFKCKDMKCREGCPKTLWNEGKLELVQWKIRWFKFLFSFFFFFSIVGIMLFRVASILDLFNIYWMNHYFSSSAHVMNNIFYTVCMCLCVFVYRV